ncbi:TPA: GNAT family N-acetyltransferase, partial [Klebsiella pneumoniae]
FAAKHMHAGISRTMVLPAITVLPSNKNPICAFYTIAPGSLRRESLPESLAKKLPRYPVPVFLLAQLAVHKNYQGSGLGKVALIKALEYLWQVNGYLRAYAVVVDCLNEQTEQFYCKFGFELLCENNGRKRMFLPMKTIGQLFSS